MILNKNKIGLAVGICLAGLHLIWALAVAIIPNILQSFLNWIFKVHFLEPVFTLTQFNLVYMLCLVSVTFLFGFIFGWGYALIHNLVHHKLSKK